MKNVNDDMESQKLPLYNVVKRMKGTANDCPTRQISPFAQVVLLSSLSANTPETIDEIRPQIELIAALTRAYSALKVEI